MSNLRLGDRCRFSELGKSRNPKAAHKLGTVLSQIGASRFVVILDGNKIAATYHKSYLEPIDPATVTDRLNLELSMVDRNMRPGARND